MEEISEEIVEEQLRGKMPKVGRSLWSDAYHRLRRDKVAVVCFAVIVLYVIIAIVSSFLFPNWAENYDYEHANLPPSWEHPLGTDDFGRSVLQETMLGARTSLTVGVMANIISVPLGMLLGAIAGYYGRFIDDFIVWLYTTLASVPGIIRLIAIKFAFQDVVLFANTPFEMDEEFYASDAEDPADDVNISGPYVMRGHWLYLVEVRPYRYNPYRNELSVSAQAELTLTPEGEASPELLERREALRSSAFDEWLDSQVVNRSLRMRSKGLSTDKYADGILFIVGNAYTDNADLLNYITAREAEELAHAAADHNVGLELNARHLPRDFTLYQIAVRVGAPITFGSDAHAPEEVGRFKPLIRIARKLGVEPHETDPRELGIL